jgi:hypothetical protein
MPPETKPEDTKTDKGNMPAEVTKVLEDIKAKLDGIPPATPPAAAAPTVPSWQDQREDIRKRMGFNEDQMRAHEEMLQRQQAPVIEKLGWSQLEKHKDIDKYKKEIEAELAIYPQHQRTPEIMEKIYYFTKGKHADSQPVTPPAPTPGTPRTRVSSGPGYSGAEPGLPAGGGGEGGGEEESLNETEKFVAQKMGISEKDYAKSRNVGKNIRELKVPDTRQANSLADVELRRLQSK